MSKEDISSLKKKINVNGSEFDVFSLKLLESSKNYQLSKLPISIKILLENVLRNYDGIVVNDEHIESLADWDSTNKDSKEIPYNPARVILQDFTGVPCVVDLAAMRTSVNEMNDDPSKINPQVPVDLVIDHSVQVDYFANNQAFEKNVEREYERNRERYQFLRWAQESFDNFRAVLSNNNSLVMVAHLFFWQGMNFT